MWVYIPKQKRQKLDMKSKPGRFVGYSEDSKGYRINYEEKDIVGI